MVTLPARQDQRRSGSSTWVTTNRMRSGHGPRTTPRVPAAITSSPHATRRMCGAHEDHRAGRVNRSHTSTGAARPATATLIEPASHVRPAPYWAMTKFSSVDDYLASLPDDKRAVVEEIERRVLVVVPEAARVIRYDMPTWQVGGRSLVHVAAWKQHVSLYPVPPEGDRTLDAELAGYAGAKGTLKLPYAEVDYELIERVVRRLLQTRSPAT